MDETTCGALAWEHNIQPGMPTLSDKSVEVLVVRTLNPQVASADVVNGLVVNHETAIRVLECGMGGENGVVGLDH